MPDPSIPSRKRSFRTGSSDIGCWMVVTFGLHCRAGLNDTKMPDGRPAACRTSFCRLIRRSGLCDFGKATDLSVFLICLRVPRRPQVHKMDSCRHSEDAMTYKTVMVGLALGQPNASRLEVA